MYVYPPPFGVLPRLFAILYLCLLQSGLDSVSMEASIVLAEALYDDVITGLNNAIRNGQVIDTPLGYEYAAANTDVDELPIAIAKAMKSESVRC